MQQNLFDIPQNKSPEGLLKTQITKEQIKIISDYLELVKLQTPFYYQYTYHGSKLNVKQTSIGKYGWRTDETGYRYENRHPNGNKWMLIPKEFYILLKDISNKTNLLIDVNLIDSCLINLYEEDANLGMHYDNTEKDLTFPIISISLGRSALFVIGSHKEILNHGDVLIMSGKSRNMKHGVEKLLKPANEVRYNLTFRKAM